jgi:hypothetical protein
VTPKIAGTTSHLVQAAILPRKRQSLLHINLKFDGLRCKVNAWLIGKPGYESEESEGGRDMGQVVLREHVSRGGSILLSIFESIVNTELMRES